MRSAGGVVLREVTAATVRDVCRLEVAVDQRHLVAPNAVSIAQAYFEPAAWFRAICSEEIPVGFAMLYDPTRVANPDDGPTNCWLWRFMIDAQHQRRGFGAAALALLTDHVRTLAGVTQFKLSFVPGAGNASALYERAGFVATGEVVEGEVVMALPIG